MSVAPASLISCPSALVWVFCKRVRGVRAGNVNISCVYGENCETSKSLRG